MPWLAGQPPNWPFSWKTMACLARRSPGGAKGRASRTARRACMAGRSWSLRGWVKGERRPSVWSYLEAALRQDGLNHFAVNVGQAEIPSAVTVGQAFVIESEQVQHAGVQV